jgi:hypothetical protein
MSIQRVHRAEGYYTLPVPYVKAEQNCGLQSCFWSVCHAISAFATCFFRALCYCCCTEESRTPNPPVQTTTTPTQVGWAPLVPVAKPKPRQSELSKLGSLDLRPLPLLEMTVQIFSYGNFKTDLPAMSQVCKAWNRVIRAMYCEQLNRATCLTLEQLFLYQSRLGGRPHLLPTQEKLLRTIGANSNWECVFMHCENLEALDFSGAFPRKTITDFSRAFPTTHEKRMDRAKEIVWIFKAVAKFCPHFKILDFSGCTDMGDGDLKPSSWPYMVSQVIYQALDHVPKLTHLNLSGCSLQDSDLKLDTVYAFIKKLPELVSLDIGTICFREQAMGVEDRSTRIAKIGEYCPKLQRLKIHGLIGGDYKASDIQILTEKLPHLTHFSIDSKLTGEAWYILADKCKNFVFLQFEFYDARREDEVSERELDKLQKWDADVEAFKSTHPHIEISTRYPPQKFESFFLEENTKNLQGGRIVTKLEKVQIITKL